MSYNERVSFGRTQSNARPAQQQFSFPLLSSKVNATNAPCKGRAGVGGSNQTEGAESYISLNTFMGISLAC